MQVLMNVPAYLQGQEAGQLFDSGLAAVPRGSGPTGTLVTTITLAIGFLNQALAMVFVPTGYTYG